jgi:peptidoglycan/LPS O-acetylase OafA/YrhL
MALTIDGKYAHVRGFTAGFDYLRIALALGVMAIHGYVLTYPELRAEFWTGWTRALATPVLPMFFALSGFLVTGSLAKSPTIAGFMTNRAVRLVPALAVEVLLSALVLGPLVTSVPLAEYFTAPTFWRYFANIAGWVHFELPGVFTGPENYGQPGIVNRSLWTVPYELECYLALLVLALTGLVKRRYLFLGITLATILFGSWSALQVAGWPLRVPATPVDGRALVVAFLVGCCIKLFSDKIRLSWFRFVIALAAGVVLLRYYNTQYLALIPTAYGTVFLGMLDPPRNRFILAGDFSYGVYLFAFPIQQTYFYLFPDARHFGLHMLFSVPLAIAYAQFSWWCVEKPALGRRKQVTRWAEAALGALGRLPNLLIRRST